MSHETGVLEEAFLNEAKTYPHFGDVIDIVSDKSSKSWIIGGFVYRNIIATLYRTKSHIKDLDIIVDTELDPSYFDGIWKKDTTSYGNLRLTHGETQVDIIPLNNINSIKRRGINPTIENFLTGTPLTVQSIVFDIEKEKILGTIGAQAIKTKTVGINNHEQSIISAEHEHKTLVDFIQKKASELHFTPILPHTF